MKNRNNNLSPIIIFTYNRLDTLKIVIKNLQSNFFAKESDLFIFSDFAKKDKDIESVNKVRCFLHTIDGFKSISIIERKENHGLAKILLKVLQI